MGNRTLMLLISIGVSVFGMPGASVAQQSSNPLRSFQNRSFDASSSDKNRPSKPTDASATGARAPVVTLLAAPQRLPIEQSSSLSPPGSRSVLPRHQIPVDAPVMSANRLPRQPSPATGSEINVDSTNRLKGDLIPVGKFLDSLQDNQPMSNRPGAIERMKSGSRIAQIPMGELDETSLLGGLDSKTGLSPGEPESSDAKVVSRFDQSRFNRLLSKLAINTAIVMCVGVGIILLARQWYKGKKPAQRGTEATILVKSTLRLGPKANLMLIETGEHRLIVACDQNGIQSVVPLTDSFSSTLETFSAPAEDESVSGQEEDIPELYSRASVGSLEPTPESTSECRQKHAEDVIRRKMESALGEQGLKDLFLQTLQSNR